MFFQCTNLTLADSNQRLGVLFLSCFWRVRQSSQRAKPPALLAVIDTETRFPTFLPNGHRLPIMLFQTISA